MSEVNEQAEVAQSATEEGAEVTEVRSEPLTTTLDLEGFFNRQEEDRRKEQPEPEPEAVPEPEQPPKKEEEEEPVLSQRGEERFKKLLGELKERTREVEDLRARMETGDVKEENPSIFSQIEKAESFENLQAIQAQAERVRNWARRNLYKEVAEGPNGEEISHEEIVEKLEIAEEILNRHLPEKANLLQQRARFDQLAEDRFPGWKDPESEQGQWFSGMLQDPQTREVINRFPNGKMILGYIWMGLEAEKAQRKTETPAPQPPQAPQRQSAPNLPGMRTQTVPSKIAPSQQQSKDQLKKQYMSSGMMTSSDLENYFNQTR
jgi:hypothetical protein